jgi:hypothetical protein
MPLELKQLDTNLNKSNYREKAKQKIKEITNYVVENNLETWEKWNFAYFCFWVLTPAYEDFIQEYFKKEKWIDITSEEIDNDDKQIFPEWEKTWIKYFNEFINWIRNWTIKVQVNTWGRNFEKNMNTFFKLPNNIKVKVFKTIYYGMYEFNALARNIRTTVTISKKELENLKKQIK